MLPVMPAIRKPTPFPEVGHGLLQPAEESPLESLPSETRFFVGRKVQLENLHKTLQDQRIVVVIPEKEVVCSIGKTAVSSQYTKGNPSVVWISAKNKRALDKRFDQLAKLFYIELSKVKDYLANQNRLIVFDGAKDPELIRGYIPQGKCQVIITSRQREWSFPQIEIGPLSLDEAVDFLCQRTQKSDRVAAKKIAEELDCLPTSLERAAKIFDGKVDAELARYDEFVNGVLDTHNERLKERSNLGDRNHNFIGREMALVALEEALKIYSRAAITGKRKMAAEVGLGGVGKTQIALQYAFRNVDKYPYLVWRINCDNDVTLQDSYIGLAEKIGVYLTDEEKKQENGMIKRVNQRLERETGWLLIYDNAENQERLKGLIPNQGGHVLITSRSPDWDTGFSQVFKVGVFKRKESIALIQKMAPLNETDADKLAELVKDLPIAVAQAAAYIRETRIPCTEYARIFNEKSQQLLPAQEPTDEYSKTVNITWQISIEKIEKLEKLKAETLSSPCMARSLMNLCAFLGSSNIPKNELLLPWIRKIYKRGEAALDDLNRTIEMLRDFSMVEMDENSISIHALVQLVTRNQIPKDQQKEVFWQALLAVTRQMMEFEKDDVKTWLPSKLCLPHAVQIFDNTDLFACLELWTQSNFMMHLYGICKVFKKIKQTLKVSQRCLIVVQERQTREPSNPDIQWILARSLENLGSSLLTHGNAKEALEHHRQALKIMQASRGEPHRDVATCFENIGLALLALGRIQEAVDNQREALKMRTAILGGFHSAVATSINNIGTALLALGKGEEALEHCRQAHMILETLLGKSHPDVAASLMNIGTALLALGKGEEALEHYRQVLETEKTLLGESNSAVAATLNNIGWTLHTLGREQEAIQHLKQALKLRRVLLGESHPDVAESLNNIGLSLHTLGREQEALEHHTQAIKIWRTCFGDSHLKVATSLHNAGSSLLALGRNREALEHHTQALEIQKAILSNSHPDVAQGQNNVGSALLALGKADEALKHFTEAYEIWRGCLGNSHPDVGLSLNNMGAAFHHLKKPQEALEFHQLALGVRKACYGESHPQVAMSLTNIGLTLADLGKEEEALEYHQQALEISITFYGEFHPDVVRNLTNIAGILWELGREEESLERYRQLYKILSTLYGELHPKTAELFVNIGLCLQALGRKQEALEHFAKAKFKIRFKD